MLWYFGNINGYFRGLMSAARDRKGTRVDGNLLNSKTRLNCVHTHCVDPVTPPPDSKMLQSQDNINSVYVIVSN